MKITYSAAISRDGFIARADGDVSWLDSLDIDHQDTGLAEFMASVDGLIMGRKTYDFVFDYGSWPYGDKLTWVCTSNPLEALEGASLIVVDQIGTIIDEALSRERKHLWFLGGGVLASSFLDSGWITNLSIHEMPIDLGEGIPLFANHQLDNIPATERQTIQKKGFRQIEMVLRDEIVCR